jgi:uncharacterized membrane protein
MKFTKKDLLVILVPIAVIGAIYPFLPAEIPRQFHFSGQPSSYMAKEFLFLVGLLPYIVYKSYQFKKG